MAILLVPGFMLDDQLWHDVEPLLAHYGPITHVDLSRDSSIFEMAKRALRHAPSEFVVIGFSMGGYVAREIARQAPERVAGLVQIATSARGNNDIQERRSAAEAGQGAVAFKGLSSAAIKSSLHPRNADRLDLISFIQAAGRRLGGEVFGRQMSLARRDERADLDAIRCRALIIAAEQDRLRSNEEAFELHRGLRIQR